MSTKTSNQRHLIALAILIGIYYLPLAFDLFNILTDIYWLRHVLISCLCIFLLYRFANLQEKILYLFFALELICIYTTILASKCQWFNDQFVTIMTIIWYAEIIIVIGSAGGGSIIRNSKHSRPLLKLFNNVYNRV